MQYPVLISHVQAEERPKTRGAIGLISVSASTYVPDLAVRQLTELSTHVPIAYDQWIDVAEPPNFGHSMVFKGGKRREVETTQTLRRSSALFVY